ncbi:capsid staple protein [Klebsiella pneumoniae]|uniref:capsid staple protein n=1 Tax=Klebsiella pneumoniae TaxID=573 RepID=UPI0030015DA8
MEMVNLKTGTDSYRMKAARPKPVTNIRGGLCITLNNDTLNKLKAPPQNVGTEVMITAKAVIKGISAREGDDGTFRSADLQITDMALAPVSGEAPKTAAQTLYGEGGE